MTGDVPVDGIDRPDRPVAATADEGPSSSAPGELRWKRLGIVIVVACIAGLAVGAVTHQVDQSLLVAVVVAVVIDLVVLGIIPALAKAQARAVRWILDRDGGARRKPDWSSLWLHSAIVTTSFASAVGGYVGADWLDQPASSPSPDEAQAPDDCGERPSRHAIDVAVVWEHADDGDAENTDQLDELDAFCQVAARFQLDVDRDDSRDDRDVAVNSVGPEIGRHLTDTIERGDPPDVAVIPQPHLVNHLGECRLLEELNPHVEALMHDPSQRVGIPWSWTRLVSDDSSGAAPVWGAFVKGAHKSLIWHRTDQVPPELVLDEAPDLTNPNAGWTWDQFVTWIDAYVDEVGPTGPAPLSFAAPAGDEWPLTDWFENQLALRNVDLYRKLADGTFVDWNGTDREALVTVLREMADVWGDDDIVPSGDLSPAETVDGHLDDRLRERHIAMAFHPSFLAEPVGDLYPDTVDVFRFPGLRDARRTVVGGDIAVVLRHGAVQDGAGFINWLTGRDAMEAWRTADRSYLAPNWSSPLAVPPDGGEEDLRQRLTQQLLEYEQPLFDLSDDRFATRDQDDQRATWTIFGEFFEEIREASHDQEAVDRAIGNVVDELAQEYRPEDPPCPRTRRS
jgi:alpha-glucoside transport system substrate-binding protein